MASTKTMKREFKPFLLIVTENIIEELGAEMKNIIGNEVPCVSPSHDNRLISWGSLNAFQTIVGDSIVAEHQY